MNCQPGDLARTVGMQRACQEANDRFVKLKNQPPILIDGEPGWELEERVRFTLRADGKRNGVLFNDGDAVYFDRLQDRFLRPIRDPGDDAVDEMVRRVPLPLPEIIPAMLDKEAA